MKKFAKIFSLITAFSLLCGCTKVPNYSEPNITQSSPEESNSTSRPHIDYNEAEIRDFIVQQNDFIAKLNAESSVHDGALKDDGEFDESGYVKLIEGNTMEHILMANTTQFYRIVLAARSDTGASITLKSDGNVIGNYYIPKREPNEKDGSFPFEYSEADCLYFTAGTNNLKFVVDSGTVDIDYILAESSERVSGEPYEVYSACANPYCSQKVIETMSYFSEIYGRLVLTAQNVSPASNAEIDAVFRATGRYPAIRSGEMAYATLDTAEDKARVKAETDIAVGYCEAGGLQSYIWHWYSPNIRQSVEAGDFKLDLALENQIIEDLAFLTDDEITTLTKNGTLPTEAAALLRDIDKLAAFFKPFDEADAVVLFQPIPEGDSGKYWWGKTAEDHKKLWMLLFDRLCKYHKIHSLIWVWNGSDPEYYPGSSYVDIIGQSLFESSDSSFASRFKALGSIFPTPKVMAVSDCDVMPNIDYMYRDNAIWLWTAPASGDHTLNMNGALSESYNSVTYMKNFYNHQKTLTLDELMNS